jgi:hypothetical protein
MSAATTNLFSRRELAHRESDGIEVTLYWAKSDGSVVVEVIDHGNEQIFEVTVPSERALDAFHHPYAYAAHHGVEFADILPQAA